MVQPEAFQKAVDAAPNQVGIRKIWVKRFTERVKFSSRSVLQRALGFRALKTASGWATSAETRVILSLIGIFKKYLDQQSHQIRVR